MRERKMILTTVTNLFNHLFELLQQVYLQTMAFKDIKTCHIIMQVSTVPSRDVTANV